MFVLRSLGAACGEYNMWFAKACIDLTKAYDSVNRGALHLHGVHPKLIALLADLHSGTYAAVKVGGRCGPAFEVTACVRQGCVVAPMLFIIFLDSVTREALTSMPHGCGVHSEVQHRQNAALSLATGKMPAPGTVEHIVMLLDADDNYGADVTQPSGASGDASGHGRSGCSLRAVHQCSPE
jgi:hypothetical protein